MCLSCHSCGEGGAPPVSSRCGTKRPPTGSQSALPVAAAADCM